MTLNDLRTALDNVTNNNFINIESPVVFAECGGSIDLDAGARIIDHVCAVVDSTGAANVILSDKEAGLWRE